MHRKPHIAIVLAMSIAACAPVLPRSFQTTPDSLLAILSDPSPSDETRQQADAALISQTSSTYPDRLTALSLMLYAPGHSDTMRIYAMDQLVLADKKRCVAALAFALPRMESWPVLQHACDVTVKLHDFSLLNVLVCSLDRPATTFTPRDRPEAKAITQLSGRPLDALLLDALSGPQELAVKIAALDLLCQLEDSSHLQKRLRSLPPGDSFLDDIRWSIELFNFVPMGTNQVSWMRYLRQDRYANTIIHAAHAHQTLLNQPDYHFAPRFVHLLANLDVQPVILAMSRQQLLDDLRNRLAPLTHVNRTPEYEHAADDVDESLAPNLSKLSRCDLLTIRQLLIFLPNPALRQALQRAGLADRADTSSEHGGLLFLRPTDDGITATIYPPLFSTSDFQYIPSTKLYTDAADALAMFHFHYQQSHNAEKAGPGEGDLRSAAKNLFTGVVITSIDDHRFDVDYFNPDGAVVDLGVYTAP